MRTRARLFALVLVGGGMAAACRDRVPERPTQPPPLAAFDSLYRLRLDSLDRALAALAGLPSRPDPSVARRSFRAARLAYKRVEYLLEFEDHATALLFNAAPLPMVDEDDHSHVIPPHGLQLIESVVFPAPSEDFSPVARREVEDMRHMVAALRSDSGLRSTRTPLVPFEAARDELARITTLGLAGYDASTSGDGIRESAAALRGVEDGLRVYEAAMRRRDPQGWEELQHSLSAARNALEESPDFDAFDRFGFIVRFARPVADDLGRLQRALALREPPVPGPWAAGKTDIYAAGAIDPRWFAPDYAVPSTPELVSLGRQLFFDTRLSATGRRSCATCHQPAFGFTDRRRIAEVDPGHGHVRNTPTLLNAGMQRAQFADQRARFLEFQFEDVMANPREMGLHVDDAARRLSGDSAINARFAASFGHADRRALTGQALSIAVAAYVRSLEAMNSRFDRAIRGDTAAISPSERRGFNLFMGKAACATCHFPPLFGGTLPPAFQESEPEVIGVPRAKTRRTVVDGDPGVFGLDSLPLHRHAFKTPSVRNVALTAPYMHNGAFRTLREVVDFYDRGGGNGGGMLLPNQTLSAERLRLSAREKRDLVAFLRALTDSGHTEPETRTP